MDIRQYLRSKGFAWKEKKRSSGLQAVFNCPFCEDKEKAFAVDLNDGAYNCFHKNKCGVSGSFWQLQKALGDEPKLLNNQYQGSWNRKEKKTYKKPSVEKCDTKNNLAIDYLKGRGISEKTINKFKIRQTKDEKAIVFPYFRDGETIGIKYRSLIDKKFWAEKETEQILYNMDNVSGELLHICEGEIDCLSLAEYGIDAVSLPSGTNALDWIENCWEWLEQFKSIYLIFDMDQAGQEAVKAIAKRLGLWRCYETILPFNDVNECLKNKVSTEELIKIIAVSKDLYSNEIKSVNDFSKDLIEYSKNKERIYGVNIGYRELQRIMKGWRMREWSIWTGRNSSGKTSFLNMIALQLNQLNEKCCFLSLEMRPVRLMTWMLMQHNGIKDLDENIINKSITELSNIYFIDRCGSMNYKTIFDMFIFANRKYGCRHFFLDNLSLIDINYRKELEEQKEIAKLTNEFVNEYDCHVHLVAHPRKGQKDTDRPDKVDVGGSGNLTNLAHNVFSLYRPTTEEKEKMLKNGKEVPDALLMVKKNREWGIEDSVSFDFCPSTKRFFEKQ